LVELVACQRPADVARVAVKAWVAADAAAKAWVAVVAGAEQARAVDVQVAAVVAVVAEVSNDDVCTNP
jgi:hypothetical protein